jgi:hypothetical protein
MQRMYRHPRHRPSLRPLALLLALSAATAACGGSDGDSFITAPPDTEAPVNSSTGETTPGDATPTTAADTVPATPPPSTGLDPAAQPLLDRLLADDDTLTLLVDQLRLNETDPLVIQENLRKVRDHLFAMDAAVREAPVSDEQLLLAANDFLTRLAPAFTGIDAVTTMAPIEVGPSNVVDLVSTVRDTQLAIFDLQVAALRATGVTVSGNGNLSATVITSEQLQAVGVSEPRVQWEKTRVDNSRCGAPLVGVNQPVVRQSAGMVATELYGFDIIEVFATEADAAAYMAAYIADTSCMVTDPAVAIVPDATGWLVSDVVDGAPAAFTARLDGNVLYRSIIFVDAVDDPGAAAVLAVTVAPVVSG